MAATADAAHTGVAIWAPWTADIDAAMGASLPVFIYPPVRSAGVALLTRAARRTPAVARLLATGTSPLEIAAALAWWPTAKHFDVTKLLDFNGKTLAQSRLLPRVRAGSSSSTRRRPPVTGALIALDEESTIAGALASLAPHVDELVVMDGGSSDATVDIAMTAGATVHHRAFDADFAAQRNALLKVVRTPWVLMLDCDERIDDGLAESALSAIDGVDAVFLPRRTTVGSDPTPIAWPETQPRLHRSDLRYLGAVHERVKYRRAVHLPVNGPVIEHHKDPLRHYQRALAYLEIDPTTLTAGEIGWVRRQCELLEAEDRP